MAAGREEEEEEEEEEEAESAKLPTQNNDIGHLKNRNEMEPVCGRNLKCVF